MARQTVVLQVFVASPSDVSEERKLLEGVINQLNQVWSGTLGVVYELIKWKTNVRPAFSADPQEIINSQIGNDYDVFIGIFWGRLGTETPRAKSGTIEEFERAFERNKVAAGSPEIMLYFKDAAIPPSKIDTEQLKNVLDFKNSISDRGGLYSVFEDQTGFESSLRAHLSAVAQNYVSKNISSNGLKGPVKEVLVMDEVSDAEMEEDDYGYIDYFEIYEARQNEMISALEHIDKATVRIGEQLSQRTDEMNGEVNKNSKDARRLIKRAADDMNGYSDALKIQLPIISAASSSGFDALSNALALHSDFSENNEDLEAVRIGLVNVIKGIGGATNGVSGMREAANMLPRISKEINKARRSVVYELDELLSEMDSITSTVRNIIESIDRMLGKGGGEQV
jgi:hypothetical protein